jgi:hypothetical protein
MLRYSPLSRQQNHFFRYKQGIHIFKAFFNAAIQKLFPNSVCVYFKSFLQIDALLWIRILVPYQL